MAENNDGFLGRWSQRKAAAVQGKSLEEPTAPLPKPDLLPASGAAGPSALPPVKSEPAAGDAPLSPPPELTLADASQLTKDSDFKPFMAGNVSPGVRNAAMKKLFADPQFNVMDGLDIYIDDYSIFEPIPESMLRQMVSAQFLNLFGDEDAKPDESGDPAFATLPGKTTSPAAHDNPLMPLVDVLPNVAQSDGQLLVPEPGLTISHAITDAAIADDHDHSDLRLQPNDAATGPEAGRGA